MKLPFKEYTVMSNNLIQKLGCADVYRTYVLLLTADKYTLTTDTTMTNLHHLLVINLPTIKVVRVPNHSMTS